MCNLTLSISSALLLSACGGSSSDSNTPTTTSNVYSYSGLPQCADTDADGVCSALEQQISYSGNYARIVNDNGAILTAHKDSELVSPFTTLIYNEVLFNPALKGDPKSAEIYLQTALGDKLGVNFSSASTTHGPKQQTEILLNSLRQAQVQGQHNPLVNIAHAVDVMIANQTLDLSGFDLRTQPNRHVSFDNQLIIHGSQANSDLVGAKSVAFNPANSKIVYVDATDNIKQIDITNSNRAVLATRTIDAYSSASSDDDDDDDDDEHKHGGSILDLLGYQPKAHQLVQVVPALNSVQSYKLYQPKTGSASMRSTVCDTTGSSGIFLTSLQDKSTQSRSMTIKKVDAYASASGSTVPPTPKPAPTNPDTNLSAKRCFNDNFNWIQPLYSQKAVIAELDDGFSSNDYLRRLNADTLAMETQSYTLSSTQNLVVPSLDETELLVVDDGGNANAVLLNSKTLTPTAPKEIGVNNASTAAFAINNLLVFGLKSNKIVWVEKNTSANQIQSLDVDGTVRLLKSSPDGKFSAAVTNSSLYILNNSSRSTIKKIAIAGNNVKELIVLNNKAVAVKNNGLDYVQFSNISGPKLKVAAQLITNSLKDQWASTPGMNWNTSNFGYILEKTGVTQQVATQFDNIEITWLPAGVSQTSSVTGANISGLDRGRWITLYKSM
ncbi:hypothetical protein [Vibrio bivalvicida]|uniref:Uncharacterized protein n=1 Tax=Vibrio bivalvicida TaxID=1276888 RepID=A0ABV4MDV4_9VIBR